MEIKRIITDRATKARLSLAMYLMIFRYMSQSDHENRMKQLQANEKYLQAQVDSYKKMGENGLPTC